MSDVFDAEIHPRYGDINLADHVDSVEAIRIVDEARIQFLRFAPLSPPAGPKDGALEGAPDHAPALVAVTTKVFVDDSTQTPWVMDDGVRATLVRFLAAPVAVRQRG